MTITRDKAGQTELSRCVREENRGKHIRELIAKGHPLGKLFRAREAPLSSSPSQEYSSFYGLLGKQFQYDLSLSVPKLKLWSSMSVC